MKEIEFAHFYPGQEVICVRSHSKNLVIKDQKYIIDHCGNNPCKCRKICVYIVGNGIIKISNKIPNS